MDVVDLWGWIGLDNLQFRLERWPTKRILDEVNSINPDSIRGWAKSLQESRGFYESWLGAQMIEAGTWPTPPIVLDNFFGLTMQRFGQEMQLGRFCLLEGHHRLAYLHGLDQHPDWKVQSDHELWLARKNAAS